MRRKKRDTTLKEKKGRKGDGFPQPGGSECLYCAKNATGFQRYEKEISKTSEKMKRG